MRIDSLKLTFGQWELTIVCKQLIAARPTSLLPFKMLSLIKFNRCSHPVHDKTQIIPWPVH